MSAQVHVYEKPKLAWRLQVSLYELSFIQTRPVKDMERSCVEEIATQMASADGDRFKDLKAFDDTKADVKGLVDAGIARLPKIFIQPAEELINGLNNCHLEVQ